MWIKEGKTVTETIFRKPSTSGMQIYVGMILFTGSFEQFCWNFKSLKLLKPLKCVKMTCLFILMYYVFFSHRSWK